MPIYEYSCEKCGAKIDVLQKMNDPAPAKCESCGTEGTMSRQVSRTSFVLKGGGWYSDLYGSSKKDSGSSAKPAASTTSSTESTPKKDSGGTGGSTPPAGGSTPSGSSGGSSGSSASPAA